MVSKEYILKIGSKGEIFPPKEIRESLGLLKDTPILIKLNDDQMIIRKVYDIEELLEESAKINISYHAMKELRKQMNDELENR